MAQVQGPEGDRRSIGMGRTTIKIKPPNFSAQMAYIGKQNHDAAYIRLVQKAGEALEAKIKAELAKVDINDEDKDISTDMIPIKVEIEKGGYYTVVGWEKGQYPKDVPASAGWKALFINYGAPHIAADPFIERARKASSGVINKAMRQEIAKIVEEELRG